MHPDLESFLEEALSRVKPTSSQIGRVVVEPDYEAGPDIADAEPVADQLTGCLQSQVLNTELLTSHDGQEIKIASSEALLHKYVRRITLHADQVEGYWIEIAPPGNWI